MNTDKNKDDEKIWIRFGSFAIGRDGYRPFVALPEKLAFKIFTGAKYAEKFTHISLIAGGVIILMDMVYISIPIAFDLAIFLVEVSATIIASTKIAKTIVVPETRHFKGEGGSPGFEVIVEIIDSKLLFSAKNLRPYNVTVELYIKTPDEILIEGEDELTSNHSIIPRYATSQSNEYQSEDFNLTLNEDHSSSSTLPEGTKISISPTIESDIPWEMKRVMKIDLPAILDKNGLMQSEKVVQKLSYERLKV
jgi:hypothetical protein